MFGEYKSTAGANSYAVESITPPCTLHYMLIIHTSSNDTN